MIITVRWEIRNNWQSSHSAKLKLEQEAESGDSLCVCVRVCATLAIKLHLIFNYCVWHLTSGCHAHAVQRKHAQQNKGDPISNAGYKEK